MMMFLVLKERLKSFYGKYATPVNGVIKFLYSLAAMALLNGNIGYRTELTGPVALLAVALVSAFLPMEQSDACLERHAGAYLCGIHGDSADHGSYPDHPDPAVLRVSAGRQLLAGADTHGISAEDSICGSTSGRSGRKPSHRDSGGSGVVIYYIISYVKQNAGVLTNDASVDITQKFVQIIRGLLSSQEMMVMIMVCVVGILCVYLLHNMSLDYAWEIAIVTGTIAQLAAVFVGDFIFHVSMPVPKLLIGALISLAVAWLYHFFVFTVDYTRTEYVQYEDDDYVYYVKAVPKVAVARTDVKVQRINNPARGRHDRRARE